MEKVGLTFLLLTLLLKGQTTFGVSEVKSNCSGVNVCLKYDANKESNTSVYWYDKSSDECVLLGKRCIQPNINITFKTQGKCMEACIGEVVVDHKVTECGDGKKECDQDLPPTSNTTSQSFSPVIAIACAVGGIALVAIVVASAYVVKRKKKIEKRRSYVEDMLHMWSSNSDGDSYESYDDNPEDNNLFDRLERNW